MPEPVRSNPGPQDPESKNADRPPVVVKKYANRRLYNTESSSYITLENLAEMVRQGRHFVVYDAKTGEDITRSVLTQIIVEEEGKGRAMLPTGFLRQLIGFYGDSMQGLVPNYLEKAMEVFAQQQEQVRATVQQTVGNLFPGMEEVSRQNLAMMDRAMSMFAPFYRAPGPAAPPSAPTATPEAAPQASTADEIAALRAEVEHLRHALAAAAATAAGDKAAGPSDACSPAAAKPAGKTPKS
jgi:polyhydroxyalkanoate synthesis repressor PhaR